MDINNKITCLICLEDINKKYVKPCLCNQGYYHKDCLKKWITKKKYSLTCEICKSKYYNIKTINTKLFLIKFFIIFDTVLCLVLFIFFINFKWLILYIFSVVLMNYIIYEILDINDYLKDYLSIKYYKVKKRQVIPL